MSSLPLPAGPDLRREFPSTYDDFHFNPIPQEPPEAPEQPVTDSNKSVDRDDELLSFKPPTHIFTLLDYSLRRVSISLTARLHGMFFMADPSTPPALYPQTTPPELTCYRRNLFQVTGSIRLPRGLQHIAMHDGNRIPIVALELCVSATESAEGHAVKLISVPWKTPANNAPPAVEDKTEKEPMALPLDIISNQDIDTDYATFPIAWKRLQFRIATANNGRRKELQQHFVVSLKLMATLANGNRVSIAEAKSTAIVVRGRSPRNFQQRRDLAIGERSIIRKGPNSPPVPSRRATTDPVPTRSPLKRERSGESPFAPFSFNINDPHPQNFSTFNGGWHRPAHGSSSAPALPTPTFRTPTLPSSKSASSVSPPSAQQPLSNTGEFHNRSPPSQRPTKIPRKNSAVNNRPQPYKCPSLPSPRSLLSPSPLGAQIPRVKSEGHDPADSPHGYFPLGIDQWQPPVDAMYRSYAVHPMVSGPPTVNGQPGNAGTTNKRCFSDDIA